MTTNVCNILVGQTETFALGLANSSGSAENPLAGDAFSVSSLGASPAIVTASVSGSMLSVTAVAAGATSVTVTDTVGDTALVLSCTFTAIPLYNITAVAEVISGV